MASEHIVMLKQQGRKFYKQSRRFPNNYFKLNKEENQFLRKLRNFHKDLTKRSIRAYSAPLHNFFIKRKNRLTKLYTKLTNKNKRFIELKSKRPKKYAISKLPYAWRTSQALTVISRIRRRKFLLEKIHLPISRKLSRKKYSKYTVRKVYTSISIFYKQRFYQHVRSRMRSKKRTKKQRERSLIRYFKYKERINKKYGQKNRKKYFEKRHEKLFAYKKYVVRPVLYKVLLMLGYKYPHKSINYNSLTLLKKTRAVKYKLRLQLKRLLKFRRRRMLLKQLIKTYYGIKKRKLNRERHKEPRKYKKHYRFRQKKYYRFGRNKRRYNEYRRRLKRRRTVTIIIVETRNNFIISCIDHKGGMIKYFNAGMCGFSGPKKSLPYAAFICGERMRKFLYSRNIGNLNIVLKSRLRKKVRECLRGLMEFKFYRDRLKVKKIVKEMPVPHNGVRYKKLQRK